MKTGEVLKHPGDSKQKKQHVLTSQPIGPIGQPTLIPTLGSQILPECRKQNCRQTWEVLPIEMSKTNILF